MFQREVTAKDLSHLASQGVWIGTSSWKYPGWIGPLYSRDRYVWKGRFAQSRFERLCLMEYAEVFKTVCVDAAYYQFPSAASIQALAEAVPDDFRFAFKVTDTLTLKRFPNLPRFGTLAGQPNPHFLSAERFTESFLNPCLSLGHKLGIIIFEFSRFHPTDFTRGRDFVAALDRFFPSIPHTAHYGVEIRNASFLHPDFFQALARHHVTPVLNSWTEMPRVAEQHQVASPLHFPALAARFLLKPGRSYADAVNAFRPYDAIKETCPEARADGAKLIADAVASNGTRKAFLYLNNRLEGNALETAAAMVELSRSLT